MMTTQQKPQTYLSNRIPRDSEHERYHPLPVLTGQSAGAGAPHDFEKIPAFRMMEHIPAFCDKNLDIG